MAAQLPRWPKRQPAVIGDELRMVVTIGTTENMTGWAWEAAVRMTPSGPVIARWNVTSDPAAKTVTLLMPESESAKLRIGCGFDVRQTAPKVFTYLTVEQLNLVGTFSYEKP